MSSRRGRSRRRGSGGDPKGGDGAVQAQGRAGGGGPKGKAKGSGRSNDTRAAELWRVGPALPEPQRIRPAGDPTALIRSLGNPPLRGQTNVADKYLAAVVERAADVATALAASADLLADGDPDGSDEEH